LLKTKGYSPVKILAVLESESNKEDPKSKRSLADLVVEDVALKTLLYISLYLIAQD
jgi:hypothetical protein